MTRIKQHIATALAWILIFPVIFQSVHVIWHHSYDHHVTVEHACCASPRKSSCVNVIEILNFAAAYRTPNLAELTSNGQHKLRYEKGDPDLVPENACETDLSMHSHMDHITFDIAGFYNILNNYIFISPTGDTTASGVSIYQYKQSNSTLIGGEAGFHFHPKPLKWLHFEATFASVFGKQAN